MIIFASICGFGFAILLIGLIFGGDTDVDAEVDFDGDVGSGPSIFSVKMAAMLMIGFGAVGFGARATTDASMFVSSMAGIAGAFILSTIGYIILRIFYTSQVSSTVKNSDIVGQDANLIDRIVKGGTGQISCVVRGREFTFLARSKDGRSIEKGSVVRIVSMTGNSVFVEKIQ